MRESRHPQMPIYSVIQKSERQQEISVRCHKNGGEEFDLAPIQENVWRKLLRYG